MGTLSRTTGQANLVVDETSCGPMCQHPACWQSNQRQEKGFPKRREDQPSTPGKDLELPTQTVYNILEDFGDDPRDRFPAKYSGQQAHERVTSSLPSLPKSISQTCLKTCDPTPAITSNSRECLESKKKSRLRVVEVQEVFDVDDLNNKWDETFLTRQYYVWVPNPKKAGHKQKTLDPLDNMSISKLSGQPQPIPSKDVTEQLIPEQMERQREEARVFDDFPVLKKKYASAHSGTSRGTGFSRGGTGNQRSARPYVDADSLQELLELPREILMSVLEHAKESDFTSKERIHDIIRQFHPPPSPVSIETSELLQQKKLRLLGNKEKNMRNPDLMMVKPVFQLDSGVERSSEVVTPMKDLASDVGSSRDEESLRGSLSSKKPLPNIKAAPKYEGLSKIPSISLGLPELPTGIRQTRPFAYKKQQYMDFSLGPVFTPMSTERSSDTPGSDHGTTVRANLASASTRLQDRDLYQYDKRYSREGTPMTENSIALQGISPSTSAKLPRTPMATPVTHPSPTKTSFQRDRTNMSAPNASQSPPPSRDISMSPIQKMIAPANSPNQSPAASPEPGTRGLGTIPETMMENGAIRIGLSSRGKMVSFVGEVPPPPPGSLDERHSYTVFLSNPDHSSSDTKQDCRQDSKQDSKQDRSNNSAAERRGGHETRSRAGITSPASASSNEEWPNVNEAAFEAAPYPHSTGLRSDSDRLGLSSAERSSKTPASKSRSNLESRESDKSSVVRLLMDESVKTESPGPPPPSPEPKDMKRTLEEKRLQDVKSRESLSMAPLYEESEFGESHGLDGSHDPGVMKTVCEVIPKPKSGKRVISVDTFVNVDIQADRNAIKPDGKDTYTSEASSRPGTERSDAEDSDQRVGEDRDAQDKNEVQVSRQTTGFSKEVDPLNLSGIMDVDPVDYNTAQGSEQDTSSTEPADNQAEYSVGASAPPPEEPEMEQESTVLPLETPDMEETYIDTEDNDSEAGSLDQQPPVDATAPPPEDEESDKERGGESEYPHDELPVDESSCDDSNQVNKEEENTYQDAPTFGSEKSDAEEDASVADDASIPAPVTRTNTAIQIVKSVIETAEANVDEIIKSGETPEDDKDI
ncbi:LOW QUALITY PROTEIN: flocculation protein FLO11-like [Haliotis rubra]|uniref:LOW QUALITY PROTEIN: flocculation protein FLO11-like n=1 Tax=Haliotis rubra TaxID=36100 RepID=UPI001EE530BF|nr:LOW QUALITY PROTEIN: flocculation protein FLO11-like [Haliotis rubra]